MWTVILRGDYCTTILTNYLPIPTQELAMWYSTATSWQLWRPWFDSPKQPHLFKDHDIICDSCDTPSIGQTLSVLPLYHAFYSQPSQITTKGIYSKICSKYIRCKHGLRHKTNLFTKPYNAHSYNNKPLQKQTMFMRFVPVLTPL